MKRLAILFACLMLASPAMAISEFGKQWKNEFLGGEDVDEDFKRAGRKAGCYVCHVKGEDKKKRDEKRKKKMSYKERQEMAAKLELEMDMYAANLEFEKAALIRDQIEELKKQ